MDSSNARSDSIKRGESLFGTRKGEPASISVYNESYLTQSTLQIYWPSDGQCYSLLTRGPCGRDQWLVTREARVTCVPRTCPCDPEAPGLCEVELRNVTSCDGRPRCVVALAAAQEGLCPPGEQLLVSPGGWGECGCLAEPPHVQWPGDGACYQAHTRGPCPKGQWRNSHTQFMNVQHLSLTLFSQDLLFGWTRQDWSPAVSARRVQRERCSTQAGVTW